MKTKKRIGFSILIILAMGVLGYTTYFSEPEYSTDTPQTFAWKYEQADSLNLDGIPETNVFLELIYPSGLIEKKLIDTTPGGCNDLPEHDPESIPGLATAQCYSAGLGYLFRVIQGTESYMVQRKIFEEASPEYTPSVETYETILELPL